MNGSAEYVSGLIVYLYYLHHYIVFLYVIRTVYRSGMSSLDIFKTSG